MTKKTTQGYNELLVEYDNDHLVVYISGLTDDDYWEEFDCFDDVNNPEDFAQGIVAMYHKFGYTAKASPVNILEY